MKSSSGIQEHAVTVFFEVWGFSKWSFPLECLLNWFLPVSNPVGESHLFRSSCGWITFCQMMLPADCLSVTIAADTNWLLMLLLKPVSLGPLIVKSAPVSRDISTALHLSPSSAASWIPEPIRSLVTGTIIKNVWQHFKAERDGLDEAGRAGEDGITQVCDTRHSDLQPWFRSETTLKSQSVNTAREAALRVNMK